MSYKVTENVLDSKSPESCKELKIGSEKLFFNYFMARTLNRDVDKSDNMYANMMDRSR